MEGFDYFDATHFRSSILVTAQVAAQTVLSHIIIHLIARPARGFQDSTEMYLQRSVVYNVRCIVKKMGCCWRLSPNDGHHDHRRVGILSQAGTACTARTAGHSQQGDPPELWWFAWNPWVLPDVIDFFNCLLHSDFNCFGFKPKNGWKVMKLKPEWQSHWAAKGNVGTASQMETSI